jgi:hypothetical protein
MALALRFNDIEWFANEGKVRLAISKRHGRDGAHLWDRRRATQIQAVVAAHLRDGERHEGAAGLEGREGDNAFLFTGEYSGFIEVRRRNWNPIAQQAGMAGTHLLTSGIYSPDRSLRTRKQASVRSNHTAGAVSVFSRMPGTMWIF